MAEMLPAPSSDVGREPVQDGEVLAPVSAQPEPCRGCPGEAQTVLEQLRERVVVPDVEVDAVARAAQRLGARLRVVAGAPLNGLAA